MKVIAETAFPAQTRCCIENHHYLSDMLSYVAVGARSAENQLHRLTASGLDLPVGMKNPTSGDLSVMMNSITAAQHPHTFVYSNWEVQSKGNPLAHAILRGSSNKYGRTIPNYHYEDIKPAVRALRKKGLKTRQHHDSEENACTRQKRFGHTRHRSLRRRAPQRDRQRKCF